MRLTYTAVLTAALALSACSGGDTDDANPPDSAPEAPAAETTAGDPAPEADAAADTEEAPAPDVDPADSAEDTEAGDDVAATTEAAAGGAPEEVELDESVTDEVLGHKIAFTGLVRDFPVPDDFESLQETGEIVLVEVGVEAGDEYGGGVQGGFELTSPDGSANSETTIVDAEMSAAGYPPFEGVSAGEAGSGWVAFQVNTAAEDYVLTYERMAASVIGSDEEIPGEVWEIELP